MEKGLPWVSVTWTIFQGHLYMPASQQGRGNTGCSHFRRRNGASGWFHAAEHCKPASDGSGHPAITQKPAGVVQEEGKVTQTFTVHCLYAVTPFWTGDSLLSIGISVLGQLASVSESSSSKTEVTRWPEIPVLAACSWKIFLYHIYLYSLNQPQ